MTAWGMGMRLRIAVGAVFTVMLGLALLIQTREQNSTLAHRLRFDWTPHMVGWMLLILGLVAALSVLVQNVPLAAIVSAANGLVFVALTVAVWPPDGRSYWFPIFTLHAAANQFASFGILARSWGRP